MNAFRLALRQVRYENAIFWRNAIAAFFTVAMPLLFLVIFNMLFGGGQLPAQGGAISLATFYVPGIIGMAVIGACFTNIAMGVAIARDNGLLKRFRGTPLPSASLLWGKVLHSTMLALGLVAVVVAAGALFYDVAIPGQTLAALIVALALGSATFCALGVAMTVAIPNADAAPAIVNAVVLPLMFVSDLFIPMHNAPEWLNVLASAFPVRHFAQALHTAFNPHETGLGFAWQHLAALAAWLALGVVVATCWFRWESRR